MTKKSILLLFFFSLLAIFAGAFFCGWLGIDFGSHWDEPTLVNAAAKSLAAGSFTQDWFNYPGFAYRLAYYGALLQQSLLGEFKLSYSNYPFLRLFFLGFSLLALVWTGLSGTLFSNRAYLQGGLAALLLATSWEYAYHSRWMAPDTLMASASILTIYLSLLAAKSQSRYLLLLAAGAGGLAMACKYPAGLVIVPVMVAALGGRGHRQFKSVFIDLILLVMVFSLVFIIVTPGAVTDFPTFARDIKAMMAHYQTGIHGGYNIEPGLPHLKQMLIYLLWVVPSTFGPFSLLLSVFLLLGAFLLTKKIILGPKTERIEALIVLLLPVLYVLYFSMQSVMIVRNIMLVLPLVSLITSIGVIWVFKITEKRSPFFSGSVLLLISLIVSYNAYQLGCRALSIANFKTSDSVSFSNSLLISPVWFSPETAKAYSGQLKHLLNDIERVSNLGDASSVVFTKADIKNWMSYPANFPGFYHLPISGPYEVNLDYYPSWDGHLRPILIYRKDLLETQLLNELENK